MTAAITTTNTWGISGPAFLAGYAVLFVVVLVWATELRRRRTGTLPPSSPDDLDRYELAMLAGGEDHAVLVATVQLVRQGVLVLDNPLSQELAVLAGGRTKAGTLDKVLAELGESTRVVPGDGLRGGAHPVEAAVLRVARTFVGVPPSVLLRSAASQPELAAARDRLRARGLLLRERHHRAGQARLVLGLGLLVLVGAARLVAGLANGRPVNLLSASLAITVLVGAGLVSRAPRTSAGDRVVRQAKAAHRKAEARPSLLPSTWLRQTPGGAELDLAGLALFGGAVLWASEPALAASFGVPPPSSWSGGGGDGGGCGGGCGGCGG
jgi:uncharacterized protein (TIGR04222 family)